MYLGLFLVLFISLLFLSKQVTTTISLFFMRITRSHAFAIQLLAILFLPGVIIHEIAHWLIASILFVPTGDIEFLPRVQGGSVKLGSVQIAVTDPIRRFCIGVAPVIFGLSVLLGVFWFLSPTFFPFTWKSYVFFYVLFEIGNTMFSSAKDLEGVVGFLILVFLFISLLVFLKAPLLPFASQVVQSNGVQVLFRELSIFSFIAIGIDVVVVGFLRLLLRFLQR